MPLTKDERENIGKLLNLALDRVTEQQPAASQPVHPPGWPMQDRPTGDAEHERRVQERSENLRREAERQAGESFAGSSGIKATDLMSADRAADRVYLAHAQGYAQHRLGQLGKARNQNIYKELLVGTTKEIDAVKDVRSHADAQAELSKFDADQGGWVKRYTASGSKLERAFHAWLTAEMAK